jgi:DNA-binding protein H-NS
MDLSKMNRDDLRTLQKQVAKELESRERQQKEDAIRKIQQIAAEAGISLEDVTGTRRGKKKTSAEARYRDPDNPSNTWAGRGRKPKWLEEKLGKGKNIEDFAVV